MGSDYFHFVLIKEKEKSDLESQTLHIHVTHQSNDLININIQILQALISQL